MTPVFLLPLSVMLALVLFDKATVLRRLPWISGVGGVLIPFSGDQAD